MLRRGRSQPGPGGTVAAERSSTAIDPTAVASTATGAEIAQQPTLWRRVAEIVTGTAGELGPILAAAADPAHRLILTGAGSSAFAGEVIAPELARRLGRPVEVLHSTDLVATPALFGDDPRPTVLVSFARSGDSPESVAAVRLADALLSEVRHLVVTCNAEGQLARELGARSNDRVVLLPPETNDRGFAMTSSFTSMALATLLAFGVPVDVDGLARTAEDVLAGAYANAEALLSRQPDRLVALGSGSLKGLSRETALKCLELTAGDLMAVADSSMGFRHGPKAMLTDRSVAVVQLSSDPVTRPYDEDIATELIARLGADRVVVVSAQPLADDAFAGAQRWQLRGAEAQPDAVWALAALINAQAFALGASLAGGKTPDNPFPSGEVNRVVQGVRIHDLPEAR
ncbi:tagatose-6-phosphate ketose isomerase [Enemella evansiae]|uniref:Tagatose-6-phosphate ketose isomerase n=1 Tax=Enemella evansiae TaxID=2016499 RepID=A0A255GAF0_9ACTN|nr:tagatose-6-phosphate ketose isomerase [Enemella evansiae]OYO12910.1 tagatose-6-phosphate ketose isomerase [Enemella evansiae]OYO19710.1 tagatose-6-phosphate ketose isomerase [Enemella evansiae]